MKRDDEFGRQLREAAEAVRPGFSEALHARTMAEVRRARATASAAGTPARPAWWMAGAAAMGLGVVVSAWLLTRPWQPVAPPAVGPGAVAVELPAVPSMNQIVAAAAPVKEKLKDARFAYLDRDGKRLARFLWRSVPGVGQAEDGTGGDGRSDEIRDQRLTPR